MKLNSTLLLPALSFAAQLTAASVGHVYTHDPNGDRRAIAGSSSLSPETARLVLAQRAGVEAYHDLTSRDAEAIAAINDFGRRQPLFAARDEAQRALILVEGTEYPEASMPSLQKHTSFSIDDAPSASASRGLFIDLAKQSDPSAFAHLSDEDTIDLLRDSRTLTNNGDLFYLAQDMEDFQDLFERLVEKKWSVTALIMPSPNDVATIVNPYGTYEMPGLQSHLSKRKMPSEEPLEIFAPSSTAGSVMSTAQPVSSLADNTPLRGILPGCFKSQSECQSTTRNCTGHGQCYLKYTDKNAADPPGGACYTCQCSATKSNNGHKTTNWGGPACQKKDVVAPFWLLAGFTVGLVFVITFGIGTLWSMGEEELPSVIGAGVSGPPKR